MQAIDPDWAQELRRRLQPEAVRTNLVRAGLFLAGWEMLKAEIQEQVRGFFLMEVRGLTPNQEPDPMLLAEYEKHVLSRHKSVFEASLLWLVEAKALTAPQAESVRRLRAYRNTIAHEIPRVILDPGHDVDVGRIADLHVAVTALGRFWGQITIDTDPQFDGKEIDPDAIRSGAMLVMDLVLAAANELNKP